VNVSDILQIGNYSRGNLSGRILVFGGDQSALSINFDISVNLAWGAGNNTQGGSVRGYFRNNELQSLTGITLYNISSSTFNRGTIKVYGIA
jgi:hypothetical protein